MRIIQISKSVTIVTKSAYGWFYENDMSINCLFNFTHNFISVVVPNEDLHINVKLKGTRFKSEKQLHKIYNNLCNKYNVKNIFINN